MRISRHLLIASLLGTSLGLLPGCKTTPETEKPKTAAATPDKAKKIVTTLPDQNGDLAFQSFLSRLRQAVAAKDLDAIAGMMTPAFGYRYVPLGEGPGVFAYWDQNNIWPELQLVMKERFVPYGSKFMVAPAEFTTAENYTGYRAGIALVNGSWKFAYFVNGTDPDSGL